MLGSVDRVKTRSGITAEDINVQGSTLDAYIQDLLQQSTRVVESLAEREFDQVVDDEVLVDGNNRTRLRLGVYPVTSVSLVEVDGSTIPTDEYRVDGGGILERRDAVWPKGWENVRVVLTHGYGTGQPADVVGVVEGLAVRVLRASGEEGKWSSISMDGHSVSRENVEDVLTDTDRAVIERYRRIGKA